MIFVAPPDERLFERPHPSTLAAKGRFTFVLLICFLLHVVLISLFVHLDRPKAVAPAKQEIPVQIIVEPPPPKKPAPPPKSKQQHKQAALDEKIATDAPRPPNHEKFRKDAQDKASHSPKAPPDTAPAKVKPAKAAASAPKKSVDAKSAKASAPQLKEHRADGDPIEAAELQRPDAPEQTKTEQAAPRPDAQQKAAQDPLSALTRLPDYSFIPASRRAPIASGKAASTYLSVVYGMVIARIHHVPETAARRVQTMGKITFSIDLAGNLLRERVVKSSGSPELDSIAMAAIRAASPFPPSPTGTGLYLNFHYGK